MIESIVVMCPSKEERQQWMDLLSQEQSVISPVRSPSASHVSFTKHPFNRLSRFYARLVRKKLLSPELMKKLLYLEYVYKPDLSGVKMRKCTVTYTIYPINSCLSDSSEEEMRKEVKENRSLMKSTLMLDVRYDLEDLRGSPHATSSASVGGSKCHEDASDGSHETCRSLPDLKGAEIARRNLHKFAGVDVLVPRTMSSREEGDDESDQFEHWSDAMKTWKSLEPLVDYEVDLPLVDSPASRRSGLIEVRPQPRSFRSRLTSSTCSIGPERLQPDMATSQHSLDSGMADSYRLNSSDLNSCYKYYPRPRPTEKTTTAACQSDSESDERNFEHQCICSSPFGSTPRSSHLSEASNSFILRDDLQNTIIKPEIGENCQTLDDRWSEAGKLGTRSPAPSPRTDEITLGLFRIDTKDENTWRTTERYRGARTVEKSRQHHEVEVVEVSPGNFVLRAENLDGFAPIARNSRRRNDLDPPKLVFDNANRKRSTQPIPVAHQNFFNRPHRHPRFANKKTTQFCRLEPQPEPIYTSGLYAHWWLKKNIPGISTITEQGKLPWHGCFSFLFFFTLFFHICKMATIEKVTTMEIESFEKKNDSGGSCCDSAAKKPFGPVRTRKITLFTIL